MAAAFLFAFAFGLITTYLWVTRSHRTTYLALAEYWVYLPGDKMPSQDEMMTLMVRDNPYHRRGASPIGPSEGLLFSDVRLHCALVLRSKNPHVFRPDQFDDHMHPSAEILNALKESKSLLKIRYASEIPLKDKRHLQFLLHAADSMSELGHAKVIFDLKQEKLFTREELRQMLTRNFNVTGCDLHTQVVWKQSGRIGRAETRGLNKIGLDEWQSVDLELDQQVIATHVFTEGIRSIWEKAELSDGIEIDAFGDTFRLQFEKMKDKMTKVKILRVHAL